MSETTDTEQPAQRMGAGLQPEGNSEMIEDKIRAEVGAVVTADNIEGLPWRTAIASPQGNMVWLKTTDSGWVSAIGRTVPPAALAGYGNRIVHLPPGHLR